MKTPLSAALAVLALSLPLVTAAQGVWRCGPDGRSFSDQPCPDGRAMPLAEARPAADIEAAQARARHEQTLAQRLHRERLAQEAAQRGNGLASLGPRAESAKAKERARLRVKDRPNRLQQSAPEGAGTWRATVPPSRRAKG